MNMDVLRECGIVMGEVSNSVQKHGDWSEYSVPEMIAVIADELEEVYQASLRNDSWGPHGMATELRQVAACCIKMSLQLGYRI